MLVLAGAPSFCLDLSETMDGRQIRRAGHFLLVVLISGNLGCSAVWQEVPAPVSPASKVCLDASWFLENPSKEVVTRFTDERKNHVADVMSSRQQGVIGISLDEALQGNSKPGAQSDTVSIDASSAVGSSTGPKAEQVHSATKIDTLPTAEKSGGRLMLKVKGGTKYVR